MRKSPVFCMLRVFLLDAGLQPKSTNFVCSSKLFKTRQLWQIPLRVSLRRFFLRLDWNDSWGSTLVIWRPNPVPVWNNYFAQDQTVFNNRCLHFELLHLKNLCCGDTKKSAFSKSILSWQQLWVVLLPFCWYFLVILSKRFWTRHQTSLVLWESFCIANFCVIYSSFCCVFVLLPRFLLFVWKCPQNVCFCFYPNSWKLTERGCVCEFVHFFLFERRKSYALLLACRWQRCTNFLTHPGEIKNLTKEFSSWFWFRMKIFVAVCETEKIHRVNLDIIGVSGIVPW